MIPLATQRAPIEDSDQTAQMRRLIRIFDGRSCQHAPFTGNRLIFSKRHVTADKRIKIIELIHIDTMCLYSRIERGWQWVRTGLPLENYKNIGFRSNTGADPLKITNPPIQHSMLGHHRPAREMAFR